MSIYNNLVWKCKNVNNKPTTIYTIKYKYVLHISVCVRARVGDCMRVWACACSCVPLLIQNATRMRRIVCCHLLRKIFHYLIYGTTFRKTLLNVRGVLILCTTFVWNVSHSKRILQDIVINVKISSCNVPAALVVFLWNCNFLDWFSKKLKYQISSKFVQWEPSCSMRMDRRTDGQTDKHDEANSRFSQICERA
jgi:hypothetical protein